MEYKIGDQKVILEFIGGRAHIELSKVKEEYQSCLVNTLLTRLRSAGLSAASSLPVSDVVRASGSDVEAKTKQVLEALREDIRTEDELKNLTKLHRMQFAENSEAIENAKQVSRIQPIADAAEAFYHERKGVTLTPDEKEALLQRLAAVQIQSRG